MAKGYLPANPALRVQPRQMGPLGQYQCRVVSSHCIHLFILSDGCEAISSLYELEYLDLWYRRGRISSVLCALCQEAICWTGGICEEA